MHARTANPGIWKTNSPVLCAPRWENDSSQFIAPQHKPLLHEKWVAAHAFSG